MRRRYVAALVLLMLAADVAAYLFLRDRMTDVAVDPAGFGAPSPSPTDVASLPDEDVISGRVVLAGAPDGSLLRLTPGGCAEGSPPLVAWVAEPEGPPERVEVPDLAQTLGAWVEGSTWWVIGADADCHLRAWVSDDLGGGSWSTQQVPAGRWYADTESVDHVRIGTDDLVSLPAGCQAADVDTLEGEAVVVCSDGTGVRISRGDEVVSLSVTGLVSLAVRFDGQLAALVETVDCVAEVRVFQGEKDLAPPFCFEENAAPLGITWAAGQPVVQVGYSLYDRTENGTWKERPPSATVGQ